MIFRELPSGRVGIIIDRGTLYGSSVANIAGKYYILREGDNIFIPTGSLLMDISIKMVGKYDDRE